MKLVMAERGFTNVTYVAEQMIEDPEAYLPNARALFEPAQCGTDGMALTLRFED